MNRVDNVTLDPVLVRIAKDRTEDLIAWLSAIGLTTQELAEQAYLQGMRDCASMISQNAVNLRLPTKQLKAMSLIIISIDVTKIDKEQIKPVIKKDGSTGKYLSLLIFENDEPDKFGNTHVVRESVSREAREKGIKGKILGNGKSYGEKNGSVAKPKAEPVKSGAATEEPDEIPF